MAYSEQKLLVWQLFYNFITDFLLIMQRQQSDLISITRFCTSALSL